MTPTERTLARALTRIRKRVREDVSIHLNKPWADNCACRDCYIVAEATDALDAARRAKRGRK
jgi:hypothetical protein